MDGVARALFEDTSPEAERVLVGLLRAAGPERRLAMSLSLSSAAWNSSLQGLARRHPGLGEAELRTRLAEFLYGRPLTAKIRARAGGRT
jgi:hypothetical protein